MADYSGVWQCKNGKWHDRDERCVCSDTLPFEYKTPREKTLTEEYLEAKSAFLKARKNFEAVMLKAKELHDDEFIEFLFLL